jgi:plastocyanin domain-containing protein
MEWRRSAASGEKALRRGLFDDKYPHVRIPLLALAPLLVLSCKQQAQTPVQSAEPGVTVIAVTEKGFEPDRVKAPAGQQITLRFVRKVAQTCADAVEVQGDPVRHMLPLNAPIDVKVTAPASGQLAFACPMNMYRGAVVVAQ